MGMIIPLAISGDKPSPSTGQANSAQPGGISSRRDVQNVPLPSGDYENSTDRRLKRLYSNSSSTNFGFAFPALATPAVTSSGRK